MGITLEVNYIYETPEIQTFVVNIYIIYNNRNNLV